MNQNGKIEWELNLAGTPIPGTPALPLVPIPRKQQRTSASPQQVHCGAHVQIIPLCRPFANIHDSES